MANYDNLFKWLGTKEAKSLLEGYEKYGLADAALLQQWKDTGRNIHNIKAALNSYQTVAAQLGYGKTEVETNGNGATIWFLPTNGGSVDRNSCPSITIGESRDGGIVVENGMPAINNPIGVRGSDGSFGVTNAVAIGIDEAAKNLGKLLHAQKDYKSYSTVELTQKIKKATNRGMNAAKELNPKVWTPSATKAFKESVQIKNALNAPIEYIVAKQRQMQMQYYSNALYKALESQNKLWGAGGPSNQKQFENMIQRVYDSARGKKNFASLDKEVRETMPWFYKNAWKGEVENVFKTLGVKNGIKFSQGGKREGAPAILGIGGDLDLPFHQFQITGRKLEQNLMHYFKDSRYLKGTSKAAMGTGKLVTDSLTDLYKSTFGKNWTSKIKRDVYGYGQIEDKDLIEGVKQWARLQLGFKETDKVDEKTFNAAFEKANKATQDLIRKEYKIFASKGFGKDASISSHALSKDLEGMVQENLRDEEIDVTKAINNLAKERVRKRKGQSREEFDKDIASYAEDIANEKKALLQGDNKYLIKKAISKSLGLDSKTKISEYNLTKSGEAGSEIFSVSGIKTIKKINSSTSVTRGSYGSDLRTNRNEVGNHIGDAILALSLLNAGYSKKEVYKNGKDLKNGLNINFVEKKEKVNEKNIRSQLNRELEYILQKADSSGSLSQLSEKLDSLKENSILKDVLKINKTTGLVSVNSGAFDRNLKKINKGSDIGPLSIFNELTDIGRSLGYLESGAGLEFEKDKKTGDIVQKGRMIGATAVEVVSNDNYSGGGEETNSIARYGSHEILSLQGTVGEMRERGEEAAAEATQKLVDALKKKQDEQKKNYSKYVKSVEAIKEYGMRGDRGNVLNAFSNERANLALITLEELADLNLDLSERTSSGGIAYKDENSNPILLLNKKRQDRFNALKEQFGEEELQKMGIFNEKDIQLGVDLGETVYGKVNGEDYFTNVAMLGYGSGEKSRQDDSYMPDAVEKENIGILNAVREFSRTPDKVGAASTKLVNQMYERYHNIDEAVQDSIYDKYDKVDMGKDSGYVLLSAMNNQARELLENRTIFKDKNFTAPDMILNARTAKAMMKSEWETAAGRKNLQEEYQRLFPKANAKDLNNSKKVINSIIKQYDINDKDYKGDFYNGLLFNRFPTIRFAGDSFGGNLAFASGKQFVDQGGLIINQDLAGLGKGDMDGDMIAFFNAAQMAGLSADELKPMTDYFRKNADTARKLREAEEKKKESKNLELKKIVSLFEDKSIRQRLELLNTSAKGAGIYGDEVYAMADILAGKGIGQANAALVPEQSFLGNFALKTIASLYQEGINIKNSKGHASEAEINSMLRMSGQAKTWDDYKQMRAFLKKAENAGIFDKDAAFKKEIIEQLNLPNLTEDDPKIKRIKAIAKKYRISWDKSSNNIPTDLLAAILTDKQLGTASLFTDGSSLGELIQNRYNDLAGHRQVLKWDNFKTGVVSKEDLEKYGISEDKAKVMEQELSRTSIIKDVNKKGAKISDFTISATGRNGVSDTLAPWITGKEQNNFGEFMKILDSDAPLSEEDKKKINLLEPKFRTALAQNFATLVGGNVSHKYAEAGITKDKRKQAKLFKEADAYRTSRLVNASFLGLSPEDFENYQKRGKDLEDLVNYTVGQKKGKVIGTELGFSSFGKDEKENQFNQRIGYMDYLYSSKNKYGENVLTVGDFKTNSKGTPDIKNILQSFLYQESLRQLKQDILASGSFTVDDYIGSGRNFVNKWIEQHGEDSLRKLYDPVKSADKIEGELSVRDAMGIISKHSINTNSAEGRRLVALINGMGSETVSLTEEEQKAILSDPSIISKIGSYVGADVDPWSLFGPELDSLKKLSRKQKELELKKKELQARREINETELPGKQKDEKVFDEEEKLLDEEITKNKADLEKEESDLFEKGTITKFNGEEYALKDHKEELNNLIYSKSYLEGPLEEAKIENMKTTAAKRQYKEAYREEKTQRQRKAELEAYKELGEKGQVKLSDADRRDVNEELESIDDYLKIIKNTQEAAKKIVESTKGGKTYLKKYKSESKEYWDQAEKESYIKQSLQIRGENEKMFSTGQSTQQKVYNLQRQIEEYDKALVYKKISDPEKAIIEKLRSKATSELGRAQDDLKLYDDLYGQGGVKSSSDYLEGKSTAVEAKEIQKLQDQQVKDQKFTSDTGFLGIDAPVMNWFQKILTGGGIYTLLAKFKKGLNEIIQKAIQLDSAMTNLRIVTGDSASDTRTLINNYSDLAKELGTTTVEVASAASEWLRQGYEVAEVNDLITASTYLSKLGMIDSATATKDLTSALKGFKLEASDAMDIVDKLTALDVEAATTAGDIAEGLAQFSNLATLNGVDIDQASAYVATIADITQQSGNSVGNAMKTIMSRYGNVKASAYDTLNLNNSTDTSSDDLNDVEKILTKLGISMRDTNLEFKDFDDILDEIAGKWSTLDTVSKRAIANAFAGTRQQEAFLSLLENYDTYEEFVETSKNSSGTAETKYQSYKESYEATKNSFTAALEELANNSAIIHTLEDLTKVGQTIIEWTDKLAKYLPALIVQINSIRGLWGKGIVQRGAEAITKAWRGRDSDTGIEAGLNRTVGWRTKAQKVNDAKSFMADWNKKKEFNKTVDDLKSDSNDKTLEAEKNKILEADTKQYKENTKWMEENQKAYEKNAKILDKAGVAQEKNTDAVKISATSEEKKKSAVEETTIIEKQEKVAKDQTIVANQQETASSQEAAQADQQEAAASNAAATSSGSGATGFNKTSAVLAGVNIVAGGIVNAATSLATQATTHDNSNGDEVESSERAQKAGSSVSALFNVFGTIPIVGTLFSGLGTWLGEKIASSIDKERDDANILAEEASSKLSALEGIESDLESIGEDVSSIESQEAVSELMSTLYSEDGEDARTELAKYLGGESALYTTLTEIKEGNEESYKKLQIAQLEAKKGQVVNQYADQMYKNEEAVSDAYNDWNDYSGYTAENVWQSIGIGYAGTGASVAVGGFTGAALVAAFSTVPVFGQIVGIGLVLAGTASSIYSAVQYANTKAEEERKENAAQSEFLAKSSSEKIEILNGKVEEVYKGMSDGTITTENGNSQIEKLDALISALETQNALISKIQDEINDINLEEGLAYASVGEGADKTYLSDMTTAQLKNLGIDKILQIFGEGIDQAGGLLGQNYWADEKNHILSVAGYDFLKQKLYSLNDEEINSVLSGSSRTLNEVLSMKDSKEKNDLLKNFATALNVPVDSLKSLSDVFGSITYAEAIMSTSDLSDEIDNYDSLISDITSGAGDVSGWMQTIISDYPELIAYMGDTPTLFKKITEKLKGLNEVYLNSAFSEVLQSTGTYTETKETFYSYLGEDVIKTLEGYGSTGVTSYQDAWDYLQTQIVGYAEDGTAILSTEGQEVFNAIKSTFEEYGISVTADKTSAQFKSAIQYQSSLLDDQINNLTEQKEALQSITSQREYENKLIEAKLKLENASKEKKRVYRAGVGWVYEADQSSIKEAQENLESVETEKTVSSLETQIADLQAQKEELNNIYDEINNANLAANLKALVEDSEGVQSGIDGLIEWMKDGVNGTTKTGAEVADSKLVTSAEDKKKALSDMETAWDTLLKADPSDIDDYNTKLKDFTTKAATAQNAGVTEAQIGDWATGTFNGKSDMSAWDVLEKGYSALEKHKVKQLSLKDSSGSYKGTVTYESFSSALSNLFKQLQNGKGTIWDSNGKIVWENGKTDDYRYEVGDYSSLPNYVAGLKSNEINPEGFTFSNGKTGSDGFATYYSNSAFYKVTSTNAKDGNTVESLAKAATGSLGLPGGLSLVNELGTEAIITPSGTITSLPSATGVVPADVTRNLWELGEVAPSLLKTMQASVSSDTIGESLLSSIMSDESTNINTINMSVNADSTFDANKFLNSVKSRIALTRNSSK